MKRISVIIIFFVLIISIFLIKMQVVSYSPEKVLADAFKSSGATVVSSELYLRGKIDGNGKTINDFGKGLIRDVLKSLGAGGTNPEYNTVENGSSERLEIDCSLGGSKRMHASFVVGKAGSNSEGSYVAISLVDTSRIPSLAAERAALEKTLNARGIRPKFNSCITGCFDGKTDNIALNAACAKIFAEAGARKVEGIREGSLISVSAFSSAIRETVDDNGNKVNLNLAIRYNSYENKTYIWLATPVITTEY
jgi:hypothetical protein